MAKKITAENALKKLDKQLECSLCLDPFKEPKLLPCFHVFCKSPCLEKLVARDGLSLQCPICRHIVPLPARGVSGLESDFHIAHLFEIQEAFSKVEQSTGKKCEICEEHQATGYCHDCEQFACDNCQIIHKKIKSSKKHKVVSLDQLQTNTINLIPPKKAVPLCPRHFNKELEIYCETCHELICYACTVRIHKDHNYDYIGDTFDKYKEEIVSGLRPVRAKLDTIQQTLKAFDSRAKEINEQRITVEADIHKEFDQLQRLLDQRRVQLVGTLDLLTQQKLKSLEAQRDHVEIIQVQLTSCLEYAEGGLETGTEEEVLAMKDPVLTRIEQISAEFDPHTIQPETRADLVILTNGKEQLQTACQHFAEIITDSDSVSPDNSYIDEDTLERVVKVGEQESFKFHARTKTNKQFTMNLDLTAELIHVKSKNRLRCEVFKQQNGARKINYQPARRGKHELHVTIDGIHLRGSPCLINVVPSPQSMNRPVRIVRGLNEPTGTAINSSGQIVVAEMGGHCISILTPKGEKITTFGTQGSRNGQLSHPWGVTVDRDDNIYVVDHCNHRVQKFTSEGKFVATVGSEGSNHLQFSDPNGICFHKKTNSLYVCDRYNHRIQVLSTDLKFKNSFGTRGSGDGQFQFPIYIALDNSNNLYVTDFNNHRDPLLTALERVLGARDYDNGRVQVFTAEGRFLRAFSNKANGEKLKSPCSIAIDSSNTVYLNEHRLHCVGVFTSQGDYMTSFGKQGTEEGQFNYISGLTVDRNDSIIVSDSSNKRLQIF